MVDLELHFSVVKMYVMEEPMMSVRDYMVPNEFCYHLKIFQNIQYSQRLLGSFMFSMFMVTEMDNSKG